VRDLEGRDGGPQWPGEIPLRAQRCGLLVSGEKEQVKKQRSKPVYWDRG